MNAAELAQSIAEPLGAVGATYYFDAGTIERGTAIGLDVLSFYALGRGGVLGDVPAEEVDDVFFFFRRGAIAELYGKGRAVGSAEVGAAAHLEAADAYARRTFGGVPVTTLRAFNDAAAALTATAPTGQWPIFDGYRDRGLTGDPVADAYRNAILLRELRGGVHTDAVKDAGLTPAEACATDHGGANFALHGFGDADRPEMTAELDARRAAAEADTNTRMAGLLATLDDVQRGALKEGAIAMHDALAAPVPVG
ncbi:MAG: helix-turn-helix domain-containing protein [Mycobacterium sp.]